MNIGEVHSVGDIARFLGRDVKGDETLIVKGINDNRVAQEGDLSYSITSLNESSASFYLCQEGVTVNGALAYIISPDPFEDFNRLTKKFSPYRPQMSLTGEDCVISDSAHLSPNCFIGHNVVIGEYVTIHPGAYIGDHTVIEDNVIIGPGAVIGHYAFSYFRSDEVLKRQHTCGFVLIEKDVEVGALTTIDAGVSAITKIGRGTKINNQVHIGNEAQIGENCMISAKMNIAPFSTVDSNTKL